MTSLMLENREKYLAALQACSVLRLVAGFSVLTCYSSLGMEIKRMRRNLHWLINHVLQASPRAQGV